MRDGDLYGWKGKILRVNLSKKEWQVEKLGEELTRYYLGGRGIGTKLFWEEVDPNVDPLGPQNKLIFCTGPLVGTGVPAGSRFLVVSKSPLTSTIANPNCGGHFGSMLKYAGYDFLIIEGAASNPVYLFIENEKIEIKDATHLWGKWVSETEMALRHEVGGEFDPWKGNNLSIALIGPAGENLVKFASIISDGGRTVGRSGLGAVMGSKKLKAIVVKGTESVKIADKKGFRKAVQDFLKEARESGQLAKRAMWGTWELPARALATGTLSALNFQRNYLEAFRIWEDPSILREKFLVRDEACFACPFRCGKRTRVPGMDAPKTTKGPEYESIALLGPNCGICDMESVIKANWLCNELGMDTINTGTAISCAMELFEKGYLPENEVGYKLNFGNTESVLKLIKATAYKEGFGALLAEGGYAVASTYGHPELFMGVKKQGMPAWHPRGQIETSVILGLQYATSNVGACHTKSTLVFHAKQSDIGSLVEWTKHYQDFVAAIDSCGLCWIIYHGPLWEEKPIDWLKHVTGIDLKIEDFLEIGERIWNVERLINLKAGFGRKDDMLPPRFGEREGPDKCYTVDLEPMLNMYYRLREWDEEGIPSIKKLARLGLALQKNERDKS
ncbi:MAG: aldehyde ferredoxin oxidoreductase family protein [candidate division WOR-3 bacterium]